MSQEEIDLLIDELGEEADVVKLRKENSSIVTENTNRRQNKSSTNKSKITVTTEERNNKPHSF